MSRTFDPSRTRAVLVGIETYDAGSGWSLSGPAADAVQFARWLIETAGVPPRHVSLILSPNEATTVDEIDACVSEHELDDPLQPDSATLDGFFNERLPREDFDSLILYWSGHGFRPSEGGSTRLLVQSATHDTWRCIDADSLCAWLCSDCFSGCTHQLLLFDVCANLVGVDRRIAEVGIKSGAARAQHRYDQYVFHAASQGQLAHAKGAERGGVFSGVLFDWLVRSESSWPIDVSSLASHLSEAFGELGPTLPAPQEPVFLHVSGRGLAGVDWSSTGAAQLHGAQRSPSNEVALAIDKGSRRIAGSVLLLAALSMLRSIGTVVTEFAESLLQAWKGLHIVLLLGASSIAVALVVDSVQSSLRPGTDVLPENSGDLVVEYRDGEIDAGSDAGGSDAGHDGGSDAGIDSGVDAGREMRTQPLHLEEVEVRRTRNYYRWELPGYEEPDSTLREYLVNESRALLRSLVPRADFVDRGHISSTVPAIRIVVDGSRIRELTSGQWQAGVLLIVELSPSGSPRVNGITVGRLVEHTAVDGSGTGQDARRALRSAMRRALRQGLRNVRPACREDFESRCPL